MRGIHRWPVKFPAQRAKIAEMFPFDDVIMSSNISDIVNLFENFSCYLECMASLFKVVVAVARPIAPPPPCLIRLFIFIYDHIGTITMWQPNDCKYKVGFAPNNSHFALLPTGKKPPKCAPFVMACLTNQITIRFRNLESFTHTRTHHNPHNPTSPQYNILYNIALV